MKSTYAFTLLLGFSFVCASLSLSSFACEGLFSSDRGGESAAAKLELQLLKFVNSADPANTTELSPALLVKLIVAARRTDWAADSDVENLRRVLNSFVSIKAKHVGRKFHWGQNTKKAVIQLLAVMNSVNPDVYPYLREEAPPQICLKLSQRAKIDASEFALYAEYINTYVQPELSAAVMDHFFASNVMPYLKAKEYSHEELIGGVNDLLNVYAILPAKMIYRVAGLGLQEFSREAQLLLEPPVRKKP